MGQTGGAGSGFFYSDPVIDVDGEHLYYRRDMTLNWDPQAPDYRDFQGTKFGAISSYNYGELFQQAECDAVNRDLKILMDGGKYEQFLVVFNDGLY